MKVAIKLSFLLFLAVSLNTHAQSVVNSLHNLSVTGPGTIRATSEQEICVFCHTPHSSSPNRPLWNRSDPGVFYALYNSTTIQAAPGQPSGSSLLCLSCHDGTIALGNVLSRSADISISGGVLTMPIGRKNLTTDLTDDHPISFIYNTSLATADGQLKDPSSILPPVKLENGYVQCTSCHDPHRNTFPQFLAVSNRFSDLCFTCHNRNYWGVSTHRSSTATWTGTGTNPWSHTSFTTVSENGCENCHNPHNATGKKGLMNFLAEEDNCLSCHNGNVASTNIESQVLTKTYTHNVYGYFRDHDPAEGELVSTMHVECEDCHNPHAVNGSAAVAPLAGGRLAGVKGVNIGGSPVNPATYQYEVCFRCHAESPGRPAARTVRQIVQNNTRLEFMTGNPSFHPVAGAGKNADCPSLISPTWSESSIVYCTDCHASDGAGAPKGPHGSNWAGLLKLRYETADNTPESAENYALCYSCHSRASILSDASFGYHKKHIDDEQTPCNACHDPHGISSTQGNTTNNTHLINFDRSIVFQNGAFMLQFVDTGNKHGYCMLRCHGKGHGPGMSY